MKKPETEHIQGTKSNFEAICDGPVTDPGSGKVSTSKINLDLNLYEEHMIL